MKTVKISWELFVNIFKYHLLDCYDVGPEIKKQLEEKMAAYKKRDLYTKSKTAKTEEEREAARKKYLDLVGMRDDFRY